MKTMITSSESELKPFVWFTKCNLKVVGECTDFLIVNMIHIHNFDEKRMIRHSKMLGYRTEEDKKQHNATYASKTIKSSSQRPREFNPRSYDESVRTSVGELGFVELQKLLSRQPRRLIRWILVLERLTHLFNVRSQLWILGPAHWGHFPVVDTVPPPADSAS